MSYGIDVSTYQGKIDWAKVKLSQYGSFALLKITKKDNTVESAFERNYKGATEAGIPVGGYRYVYAKTIDAAKNEAHAVVKVLNGRKLPVRIWLDMEDASIKNIGKAQLTNIIEAEAAIFKAAGIEVGIYCNKDWYYNILDYKNLKEKYPFWIARYPSGDNGTLKESLSPKEYADMWQYSSKGKVPGITGNVDLNIMYNEAAIMATTESKPSTPSNDTSSTRVLKVGCKGEDVLTVQRLLGYKFSINYVNIDGDYTENTAKAVREFQLLYGLEIDGKVGPATLNALNTMNKVTPKNQYALALQKALNAQLDARLVCDGDVGSKTVAKCPVLKNGSNPEIVKVYQTILNDVYGIRTTANGNYSIFTKSSTKKLQKNKGIAVDGVAGPQVWTAISKDI